MTAEREMTSDAFLLVDNRGRRDLDRLHFNQNSDKAPRIVTDLQDRRDQFTDQSG
jgi:hypothetical protein